MAKKPKKKATKKKPTPKVTYTPFSMIRRVNDLARLEGKANRTAFEQQVHGLMIGFDFLHHVREGSIDKSSSSRIGLQPYLDQYVGVAGRICDVRRKKEGVSLLVVNPSLIGTFGRLKRSEIIPLIKEANGREAKHFQTIPNQPVFSSHVWLFLPEVDASLCRDAAIHLGSVVTFYAKVETYKGKVSTSHLRKAPKYGLGDVILNEAYMPYMVQKMDLDKFTTSRSGLSVQTMFGNVRRGSMAKFNQDFALATVEGAKVKPNVDWFLPLRKLSRDQHWCWIYNYLLDYDPEVQRGLSLYSTFRSFIIKDGQRLSVELEALRYRYRVRKQKKESGELGVYDLITLEHDSFTDLTDVADYLKSEINFTIDKFNDSEKEKEDVTKSVDSLEKD